MNIPHRLEADYDSLLGDAGTLGQHLQGIADKPKTALLLILSLDGYNLQGTADKPKTALVLVTFMEPALHQETLNFSCWGVLTENIEEHSTYSSRETPDR